MFEGIPDPPNTALWLARTAIAAASAAGAGLLAVPAARRLVYPDIVETRLRDHILFDRVLEDERTVRCTDGTLFQVIEIGGKDLSAVPEDVQENLYRRRLDWVHRFAGQRQIQLRVFSIRELHDGAQEQEGRYPSPALQQMMSDWAATFKRAYRNRHYVVISVGGGEDRARELLRLAVSDTEDMLRDYRPRPLTLGRASDGGTSELNTFLAFLLNPGQDIEMRPVTGHNSQGRRADTSTWRPQLAAGLDQRLADHLISTEVEFLDGGGVFQVGLAKRRLNGVAVMHGGREIWMGTIGIAGFGDKTSIDMIQHILALETELVMLQHIDVLDDAMAEAILRERLKRNTRATVGSMLGMSGKMMSQFSDAIELLQDRGPDHISLVQHQLSIFVFAEGPEALDERMRLVERTFKAHGMSAIRERSQAEAAWFSQFVPHRAWVRPALLASPNIATSVSFESPTAGLDRCDWGRRAVTRFKTLSGAPYDFCWHRDDQPLSVGHTMIIGPTGGGKSMLLNFLSAASLGYDTVKVFLVDRSDGSYVTTVAAGGQYLHLQSDSKELERLAKVCALNPLQMDLDSGESTGGPTRWLSQFIRDQLCELPADDQESEHAIGDAVRAMVRIPRERRSLAEIHRALPNNLLAHARLKRWVDGEYSNVLNGAEDALDFSRERYFAFAFDRILNDPVLAKALLPYLAYRIVNDMERQGMPWLLVLDEAAALVTDDGFRKWYFELLQEARKKRGVVVSAFQRVGTLLEYGNLAELVLQQCPNKFILPNEEMSPHEGAVLGLSDAEYAIVTKRHPIARALRYFVLLKREGEGSVLLNTNLAPMGRGNTNLLISGRSPADALRRLQIDYGDNEIALRHMKDIAF